MSRQLPPRPNLEYLRKEAKDLLEDLRQRNPESALADALHAVARAYGFPSWPKLKSHVESLRSAPDGVASSSADASAVFTGIWIGDMSTLSERREAERVEGSTSAGDVAADDLRSATIQFSAGRDVVTIVDVAIDGAGLERRNTNRLHVDGREHPADHGYSVVVRWAGPRTLEAVTRSDGGDVARVTYEVSTDGKTLTLLARAHAHRGYPAAESRMVFKRG